MEHIANIISALNNNTFALIVVLLFVVSIWYGTKRGVISFKGKGLEFGIQDRERRILQRQTTYVHAQMDSIANLLNKQHPDFEKYHTFWVCKCVEIEWIRSIHYNHIEDTDGYREDRYEAIKAIVQKKAEKDYFFSPEFEDFLKQHVDTTVKKLTRIRKNG